jgi:hypothetical protein
MVSKDNSLEWLTQWASEYRLAEDGIKEVVEDFDEVGKLRQGFSVVDEVDEIDIGDEAVHRPTYVSRNLTPEQKVEVCKLLNEFVTCFAWEYT